VNSCKHRVGVGVVVEVVEVEMGRCTVVVVLNFSSRGWTPMAMKSSSSFSLAPFSFLAVVQTLFTVTTAEKQEGGREKVLLHFNAVALHTHYQHTHTYIHTLTHTHTH